MRHICRIFSSAMLLFATAASMFAVDRIETPLSRNDFEKRYKSSMPSQLKALLESDTVTALEKEGLRFMYAYMTLPDIMDRTPQYYLQNIRGAIQASEEMPWGKDVPDREFRHFVLSPRVNNENLDDSRDYLYAELKDRIKGMSMEDAILEVNHWCHEKATYRPSDGRTNSPSATIRSALGRCGEESTFGVAALRSVGIPARQIYTPRWAHTDDNHAWVEAWANGKWYFLGACEPEPVLNLAWFNAPASRGMMMNTRVIGRYDGPEEVLLTNAAYTDINVTSNYAPTSTINVTVKDKNGSPVPGAKVRFCIYNYAEFFPVCTKEADANGKASIVAGKGDMIIWAYDGDRFGISKASASAPATVTLEYSPESVAEFDFDIVPPPVRASMPPVTKEQTAMNDMRKAQEDSIRIAYMNTFYTPEQSEVLAKKLGLDSEKVKDIMTDARGNWRVIESFLNEVPETDRNKAIDLLSVIAVKDLNDIDAETLRDHVATPDVNSRHFKQSILNPRVWLEQLTPYKHVFRNAFSETERNSFRANPDKWSKWVSDNITIDTSWNPLGFSMHPEGVLKGRKADTHSTAIFFVSGARSFGIPARLDPVTCKTQYADNSGKWIDVDLFGKVVTPNNPKGRINISYTHDGGLEPKYYPQFTIAKISDGIPSTLELGELLPVSQIASEPIEVDAGQYMMVTGRRMADGSVLAKIRIFTVQESAIANVPLTVRHATNGVEVIGNFDAETRYKDPSGELRSILSTTGRGYYVLGLIAPSHEPSAHALNDISAIKDEFEKWGKSIVLLLPEESASRFDSSLYKSLPSTIKWGSDPDGKIAKALKDGLNLTTSDLPIFIIADTFNRVVAVQQGYTIGLGETLLNTILQLSE